MFVRKMSDALVQYVFDSIEWDLEKTDERIMNAESDAEADSEREYFSFLVDLKGELERLA